jgi:outer membrane scaffolding protein for murein synthesis (MipA/OmpV family)
MSHHGHGHDHGEHHVQTHTAHGSHHPSGRPGYFSEQQWADFQRSDRFAGGMVVGLMASIFTVGLVLYTTIALIV